MLFSCSLNKNIDNTEWSYVFSLKYQMDLLYVFWDYCEIRQPGSGMNASLSETLGSVIFCFHQF